jgi:predicted GH43/DUF377 family glycosyl hydrolase
MPKRITTMPAPRFQWMTPWNRLGPCLQPGGVPLTPLEIVGDPCVRVFNGLYHMWFTAAREGGSKMGIAHATSVDGFNWSVEEEGGDTKLVVYAPPTAWDGLGVETNNVILGPDGVYRMYYTGNRTSPNDYKAIGLATSNDLVTWTRRSTPVLTHSLWWEKNPTLPNDPQGVLEPSVIWDGTQYVMWYVGLGGDATRPHTMRIGRATSTNGTTWSKKGVCFQPPMIPGQWDGWLYSHVEVVADPIAGYHMFYHGADALEYVEGLDMQKGRFGHAYSTNGTTWTKDPNNPILVPLEGQTPTAMDAWTIAGPSVLMHDTGAVMWYAGYDQMIGLHSNMLVADWNE